LISNVQMPRWTSTTAGSAGAAGKSAASQPAVEDVGSGPGGIWMSLTATSGPVTSPLPE
jgi:hypothetical protein